MIELFVQILILSLNSASCFILVGIGFLFCYKASSFINFSHGVIVASGAYFAFVSEVWLGIPFFISIFIAIAFSALLGCLINLGIYRPLKNEGASSLILLLASLGVYIVIQNIISLIFGDDTKSIRSGVVKEGIAILGARITPIQITTIFVSIGLTTLVWVFLRYSKMGRAMRAVANDAELARISGIDSDRVILWAFGIGSGLAGIAGILVALDVDMTPTMGMNALMMGVVAMIIGGVGSIPGVALGALLLGMAQQFGAYYISSQWQDAIAFIILFVFLLFRPQGFLGRKVKKATI